jgi:hypothetical protein
MEHESGLMCDSVDYIPKILYYFSNHAYVLLVASSQIGFCLQFLSGLCLLYAVVRLISSEIKSRYSGLPLMFTESIS